MNPETILAIINEVVQIVGKGADYTIGEALAALVNQYESLHEDYKKRYERYKATEAGTPIFDRSLPDFMKIDNHINNSFMSEIIDTKQGYMIGIPITYKIENNQLATEDKDEEQLKQEMFNRNRVQNRLHNFHKNVDLHDLNMETIKMSSICGTSSRLLYVTGFDKTSKEPSIRAMNLDPWETIFIYNRSGTELLATIRYYKVNVLSSNAQGIVARTKLEVYDKSEISYFIEDDNHVFELDESEPLNPRPHMFNGVPLYEYVNNKERQGDCDKILELIDAYDRCVSDLSSELEQFRLAYIALYGLKADKADIYKLKQTGMFEMTKDGKVEFITKKLDIKQVMLYLDRLENNIIRFAKSVNFKDENFYGNLSGVAIRYKLMQLEEKAMTTQVKFEVADKHMWKLLEPLFNLFNSVKFDHLTVERQFTRNIPVNILEEARIQTELEGVVATKTRLGIASFIKNADLEYQALIEEKKMHRSEQIDFVVKDSVARLVDIEAGGPTNRNTNGTVEEQ